MKQLRTFRKSAGVALVTAIFLLVVLAGLAVAIVSVVTTQQSSSAMDVMGVRAYQAAKAGTEWALYTALRTGGAPTTPAATVLGCPSASGYTFAMPAGTSLTGFTVTVTCGSPSGVGGHFWIRSTACNSPSAGVCPNPSPGADYVQRVVTVQL